jgi:hypothetical protein
MRRTTWARAAAVVGAVSAILLAGQPVAQAARPPVPVHASTRHPVTAPASLRPGNVHLRNTGSHPLYFFRRIDAGPRTLVKILNSVAASDPSRLFRHFRLIDVINGSSDIYVRLTRGTYYLADATADRFQVSDIHTLTVGGARQDAKLPQAKTVNISRHNVLTAPATVRAGSFVRLRNADSRVQTVAYFRISRTVSAADLQAFLAHPSFDSLFQLEVDDAGGLGALAGHQVVYVRFPKHSGRYILMTLPVPTDRTGPVLDRTLVKLVTAR